MQKLGITLPFRAGQSQRYTANTDLYARFDHEDLDAKQYIFNPSAAFNQINQKLMSLWELRNEYQ